MQNYNKSLKLEINSQKCLDALSLLILLLCINAGVR